MKSFRSLNRVARGIGVVLLATAFVACGGGEDGIDGVDGTTALISTSEASEGECADGGTVISVGVDTNGNGELDAEEVTSTTLICNGVPGDDGAPSLLAVEDEPPGENCIDGGVRITSGIDANEDGILQESEVVSTEYICKSTCSPEEYALELGASDAGDVVYNGFDRITFPISSENTELVPTVVYATSGFEFEFEFDRTEGVKVSPMAGEGELEIVLAFTDGCGLLVRTLNIANVADGESTVYLGHFFSGAGEVDLNLAGTDETVATFTFSDVLGPAVLPSGAYSFDAVAGGDVAGTTPEWVLAPEKTYVAYAFSNEGELDFGFLEVETSAPAEGKIQLRLSHLVDGVGAMDVFLSDDLAGPLASGVDFLETSDFLDLDAGNGYVAIDASGDGSLDLEFFQSEGLFEEGLIADGFVFRDGDGRVYLALIDYLAESSLVLFANATEKGFSDTPNIAIAIGGTGTTILNVSECGSIGEISMYLRTEGNFLAAWKIDMTVSLTSPEGTEIVLWDKNSSSTGGFDGVFNVDYDPNGANSTLPISSFIGDEADGDWTLSISTLDDTMIEEWSLTILCLG